MNAEDARAYAAQWEGAYMGHSSQRRRFAEAPEEIARAAGAVKKDGADSAFVTGPYQQSKKHQVTARRRAVTRRITNGGPWFPPKPLP